MFGAALHGGNIAETNSAIAIAYDPTADSWRELPDSNLDTNANDAIWIGDGLLAWDYNLDSQIYDPVTDRWSDAGNVPTDECEDFRRPSGQGLPKASFAGIWSRSIRGVGPGSTSMRLQCSQPPSMALVTRSWTEALVTRPARVRTGASSPISHKRLRRAL